MTNDTYTQIAQSSISLYDQASFLVQLGNMDDDYNEEAVTRLRGKVENSMRAEAIKLVTQLFSIKDIKGWL